MKSQRKRFVGLDIHKDVVEYCILDAAGKKLDGGRIICEHSVLINFAEKVLAKSDILAMEATTNTWSIVDILEPYVAKIVIGNPLKTKAIAEAKIKTDKVDALILAQLLRCDFLPSVWIPDTKTRVLRRLSSFRKSLVQEATSTKNRIKNVLNHLLIKHVVSWTKDGLDDLRKIEMPTHERIIMDSEIAMLENFFIQIEKVEIEIRHLAYEEENVRLLMTLPGVDYNTATAVLAAFGDISRFRDASHAASYLGLVPSTRKSADMCHHGPITKAGSGLARSLLCEAAQHFHRHNGPLGVFFRRIAAKKGWGRAIVAGAHKLAVLCFHMLKNKEPYRYATVFNANRKLSRLRRQVTGEPRPSQRFRYAKEMVSKRPQGDVTVRYTPPLADLYEREGLPKAKCYAELSPGEKRVLEEMGLTEHVLASEKIQMIVRPKQKKELSNEKKRVSSATRHPK
jgi:transposase